MGNWRLDMGGTDKKEVIAAIHKAIDMGINSIDTATIYGFGLSERIVNEAVKGMRDKVNIFTRLNDKQS